MKEKKADFDFFSFYERNKNQRFNIADFDEACKKVREELDRREQQDVTLEKNGLERQKNALLGMEKEVQYYKTKIKDILQSLHLTHLEYPAWYDSLEDAVYAEILGFAGISDWIAGRTEALKSSSSCKILGDRIYYMIGGEVVLQPQRINKLRRKQLRDTLLLTDATKNRADSYHEVYLTNGSRVTIFNDTGLAKKGQDCIIFRKYFVNTYTFEEQAARHTIPDDAVDLFHAMVRVGYNVAFTGPVRSAKTTFLTTWQTYEDPKFEGLLIESDPEIPLHELMPETPIQQLVPDQRYLDTVIATAKRSDAKYVILGEARDGRMLNVAVEAANMGTRRSKVTFHNSETVDFCYDVAEKITKDCGGSLMANMIKVAKSFHYVFNFFSLHHDQGQKRLKGIWEVRFDPEQIEITMHQICKYDVETDSWLWSCDIGQDKRDIALEEDYEAFQVFERELARLAEQYPNPGQTVFTPPYLNLFKRGESH